MSIENNEVKSPKVENQEDVVIKGKVVDGKIELDQCLLDEVAGGARTRVDVRDGFVAVNAPFDPVALEA